MSQRTYSAADPGENTLKALIDLAGTAVTSAGGIVEALLRASTANPYIGIVSAWILGDILQKAGLIQSSTNLMIKGGGLAVLGVDVASGIADIVNSGISDIDPLTALSGLFSSKNVPTQVLSPTATTIVFGSSVQELAALIPKALPGK